MEAILITFFVLLFIVLDLMLYVVAKHPDIRTGWQFAGHMLPGSGIYMILRYGVR